MWRTKPPETEKALCRVQYAAQGFPVLWISDCIRTAVFLVMLYAGLSFSCFYFNNCYVFVQQCGQFISRKSLNVTQPRIAPRIGAEEYDKLIAGI